MFRGMKDLLRLERALARAQAAGSRDDAAAAEIIERIVAHPYAGKVFDLPGLLEELADCYANTGRYDEAIGAMNRALAAGWEGQPDGRHRIAEFLLQAGRAEEAHALYAAIKSDTPDDVWLYNVAGLEYAAAGDHERALQWLTEGLELALRTGDPERLVDQLSELRAESLAALGREPDLLQEEARTFLARAEAEERAAEQRAATDATVRELPARPQPTSARVIDAVGWFPPSEFPAVLSRWPGLKESWDATTYEEYCRLLQGTLLKLAATGLRPRLAPIRVEPFTRWCEAQGLDPGTADARSKYAAELAARGESIPWPPGRNDPCWCRSSRKYKKCCGTAPPARWDDRTVL